MCKEYYMPTHLYMGEDCIKTNSSVFLQMGKKALIVTGANSAKKNGSLNDILAVLSENNQSWALYDKVMSNPTLACVYEGAAYAKAEKVDFIIAIGGGSPMDAAKAINLLACQDIPENKLFSMTFGSEIMPMVFVPTTAGTGSEVTSYSILTNDHLETKTSISSPILFPKAVFLDAKYTENMPIDITVNTAIDALSHAVEGMLSVRANLISDSLARESIRRIASCFESLKTGLLSKEQRFELLCASTLGGMVISSTKTTAVHSMGYSLTYFHNVDHGRANGLLLGAFLEYIQKSHPQRIKDILSAMRLGSVVEFKRILDELLGDKERLTKEEIEIYADKAAMSSNSKNSIKIPSKEDLIEILHKSLST